MSCEKTKILKKKLKELGLKKDEVFVIINHPYNTLSVCNEKEVVRNFDKIRSLLIENNICEASLNISYNHPEIILDYNFTKKEKNIKSYYTD